MKIQSLIPLFSEQSTRRKYIKAFSRQQSDNMTRAGLRCGISTPQKPNLNFFYERRPAISYFLSSFCALYIIILVYTYGYLKSMKPKTPLTLICLKPRNSRLKFSEFIGYQCIITSFGGHRASLVSSEPLGLVFDPEAQTLRELVAERLNVEA